MTPVIIVAAMTLRKEGPDLREALAGFLDIVDDVKLAATFRHWSELGNGAYFDAKDAAALGVAMSAAMQPGFEVVDAQKQIVAEGVAGGEPIRVMPGSYSVRLKDQSTGARTVTVKPKETAAVKFGG